MREKIVDDYTQRLAAWRKVAKRLGWRASLFSLGGFIAFVCCVIMFFVVLGAGGETGYVFWLLVWIFGWALVALIALLVGHDRTLKRRERALRVGRYYEQGIARLEERWTGRGQQGREYQKMLSDGTKWPLAWLETGSVDAPQTGAGENNNNEKPGAIFAEDLDLFGKGSLYELLCQASTPAGRDTLAAWLLAPAGADEIRRRQSAVRELAPMLPLREGLTQAADTPWRQMLPPARAIAWAEAPPVPARAEEQLAAVLLSALTIAAMVLWMYKGPVPFAIMVAVDWLFGSYVKERVRRITDFAERASHGLSTYAGMMAVFERATFAAPLLRELHGALTGDGAAASREIRRLARRVGWFEDGENNLALRPIFALLFGPLHFAWAIERWRGRQGRDIGRWLRALGQLEALCSLAAFTHEHPADVFPEIISDDESVDGAREGGPVLEGRGLAHPLMPEARATRNDIALGGGQRLIVLSGSNMSGKSTFLRTLGANIVLAQAGATVRAAALRLTPLTIGSSIHNTDSLQEGVSRFYAEIIRIREIVEQARAGRPLLFLIDEMLSGTNSHDRRIAAEAIVRRLVELGGIGLVTTHDLALTIIADELTPRASNAHFADQLEDGKIHFDYRLRPGVIQRGNALELMRSIGLDV